VSIEKRCFGIYVGKRKKEKKKVSDFRDFEKKIDRLIFFDF
jgi:hypothetical protein